MDKIYQIIAKWVPRKLRYFIVIDAWAKATTGKYSSQEATGLTVEEILKRIKV